jgi:hypothetical protein
MGWFLPGALFGPLISGLALSIRNPEKKVTGNFKMIGKSAWQAAG